jgi:putative acetyltransferase
MRISHARSEADYALARGLFEEYAAQLAIDLCFQGFSAELETLAPMYGPPSGCLLLAWHEDAPCGCVGLRRLSGLDCEMKRLYVQDRVRGRGYGRQLAITLIECARELGYERMRLDTLESMAEARRLYSLLGFRHCEPYYQNPLVGVRYMELNLRVQRSLPARPPR